MIDTTLIDTLKILADKEKKIKEYKRRLRLKGKIIAKSKTKKKNIPNMIKEVKRKFWAYQRMKSYADSRVGA